MLDGDDQHPSPARLDRVHNDWLKGPRPSKPWGYLYEGLAIKPTD